MRPKVAVAAVAIALALAAGACTKAPTPGGTTTTASRSDLPFAGSPDAATLADAAGLGFPDSVTDYRSVRVGPSELDVTFQLPAADVSHFVEASDLGDLAPGRRIIVHPSPLWDLDPGDGTSVESAQSEVGGLVRRVEIVSTTGSDQDTVRLIVATA